MSKRSNVRPWERAASVLLSASMTITLIGGGAALAAERPTTAFPEYYTRYEEVPGSGTMTGNDHVALGLQMTDAEIDTKIEALLNTMTGDEKAAYLGGNGTGTVYGNAGYLKGTPRLGVPESRMHDGPSGVLSRWPTTNTPDRQMAAATWDDDLIYDYGNVYGTEDAAIGANIQLGSQYDVTRTPEFGRANDQYGEDPYLLSRLAAAETEGMQAPGVVAVGKHFAAFAQSASPAAKTNINVSEQALHELYLPAFEAAVKKGGMLGMMSSYNAINGVLASSNTYLQLDVLRDMWGFKGLTVTDWGGNDGFTLNKGTDIEMPSLSANSLANAEKEISDEAQRQETIDSAVRHVLYALGHAGYLHLVETYTDAEGVLKAKEEPGRTDAIKLYADSATALEAVQEQNNETVLKVAEGGGVLLENRDNTLPIAQDGTESVAVIGVGGKYTLSGTGGERSYGVGYEMTSPYEALKDIIGDSEVSLEPVFDNGGSAIPSANLFVKNSETGEFTQGFEVQKNGGDPETVKNASIEYLPAADSFTGGPAIANDGGTDEENTYTWTTYLKVDESGDYKIVMHGLGGSVSAAISKVADGEEAPGPAPEAASEDSVDLQDDFPGGGWPGGGSQEPADPNKGTASVSYASSQGVQWHNGDYCTDTGMSISSGAAVSLEAGKYYEVVVTGIANRTEKDLQLRLAWLTPDTSASYNSETDEISGGAYDNALALAENSDKVVVFVDAKAQDAPSGRDADHLNLSADQERLILDVAEAAHAKGNKVIVVINNETAITIHNWVEEVDAVLMMYRPGQKGGVATANLLTGVTNPSGKLAYTMPMEGNETIITYNDENWNKQEQPSANAGSITKETLLALNDGELERYFTKVKMDLQMRGYSDITTVALLREALGSDRGDAVAAIVDSKVNSGTDSDYDEGILTGYRWYDANHVTPRYDFGYGLSYTTFAYSDLSVKEKKTNGEAVGYDVTFTVTNTGSVTGSEVAQLYLGEASGLPAGIQSAPVQLAGYTKIKDLAPGANKTVKLHVDERALSYWNTGLNMGSSEEKWTIAEGERTIYVGPSSDELPLSKTVTVDDGSGSGTGGSSGSGGSSSSGSRTETVKNPDGSTTTTVTKSNGDTVATTIGANGDKTVVTTTADGVITITAPKGKSTVVEIPAANVTPGTVAVTVDADGTETVLKNSVPTEKGLKLTVTGEVTVKVVDKSRSFTDVAADNWAYASVQFVAARDLFTGTSDSAFSPSLSTTRGMVMTVLARMNDRDTTPAAGKNWYDKGMAWAMAQGISDGTAPEQTITRESLAVMLYRYAGSPKAEDVDMTAFTDAGSVSGWASDAMLWAVKRGIITGSGNKLSPNGAATRAEVAAMLQRFLCL